MGKISDERMVELYGSVEAYKKQLHNKLSGKHFYTNGIEDRKFGDDEEIPKGWWRGRTNSGKGTKGAMFINNGIQQILIKIDKGFFSPTLHLGGGGFLVYNLLKKQSLDYLKI